MPLKTARPIDLRDAAGGELTEALQRRSQRKPSGGTLGSMGSSASSPVSCAAPSSGSASVSSAAPLARDPGEFVSRYSGVLHLHLALSFLCLGTLCPMCRPIRACLRASFDAGPNGVSSLNLSRRHRIMQLTHA
jgi:hypothetical protein